MRYDCYARSIHLDGGKGLVIALVEYLEIVGEFFECVIEDALGLIEGDSIDEVFIIEVHVVDASHDTIHLLFFGAVHLLHHAGLVHDLLLVLAAFLPLPCHSNQISLKVRRSPGQEGVDVGLDVHGWARAGVGVLLKVGDVAKGLDCRHVDGLEFLLEEVFPAEAVEPSVLLNVVDTTVLEVAVALGEVGHQQVLDQRLGVLIEGRREGDLPSQDVLVDAHRIIVVEGIDPGVHFVDEYAQRPPIHGLSMSLVQNHLGRDVLRRPADGERPALGQKLSEAEVSELQVSIVADQQIFRLEVAEDDILAVQVLEAAGDGGRVEARLVSGEGFHVSEVGEQLSSVDELKHEVEVFGVLGESLEGDDKRVADLRVHEVLVIDVVDLLRLHDLVLVQQLQGNVLPRFFILGHLHLAKATLAEYPADLIVLQLEFLDGLSFCLFHGRTLE